MCLSERGNPIVVIVLALVAMYRLKVPLGNGAIVLAPCLLLMFVVPWA